MKLKEMEVVTQKGLLTIESSVESGIHEVGIQTTEDGRIWLCVDGAAFIRFKPLPKKKE